MLHTSGFLLSQYDGRSPAEFVIEGRYPRLFADVDLGQTIRGDSKCEVK